MIKEWIALKMEVAVQRICDEMGQQPSSVQVHVEQPVHMEQGDFSSNIAMQLAKMLKKPPMYIAQRIITDLGHNEELKQLIVRTEVAAPGFINMFVDWRYWAQMEFELPAAPAQKVIIEHTSINPNKSAHIGHLRNACIGDTLVRMLRRIGSTVEVHNYIDDLGNQLADTLVGLLHVPQAVKHHRFGDYCWELYARTNHMYAENPELGEKRTEVLDALEEGDNNTAWIGMLTAERIVREHVDELRKFGIGYDLLVWESDIVREGFWEAAFLRLMQTPLFYKEEKGPHAGCWVLKPFEDSEKQSIESDHRYDKVLVRSNGILTYTAKDIAYHLWKFGMLGRDFKYKAVDGELWTTAAAGVEKTFGGADMVVNVIDVRQEYPQAMVKLALQTLGYVKQAEQLKHASYGVVSLSPASAKQLGIDISDGKSSYAMSGRQGIGIKVHDLIERMENIIDQARSEHGGMSSKEIATAAIRYYLLRFHLQTEVIFDLQQATEITGNTGVYVMYAHARAMSVLNKARELGVQPAADLLSVVELEKVEAALFRHLSIWQDTLHSACSQLAPHILCSYSFELAGLFNNFYANCPILKADDQHRAFRVWLTSKVQMTLGDALQVIGLPAPERM